MCYTYLNGKVSEAVKFDATDAFLDSIRPATLTIDSQKA
jgi:hypothetical protein